MKIVRNIFTIFASAAILTSCADFLDRSEEDFFELDQIQKSFNQTRAFANNVYGYLRGDFCSIDGAMQDAASDDAIHIYESGIQTFVNGSWAPNKTIDDLYGHYYSAIRDANFYLTNLTGLTFDEWSTNEEYADNMKEYSNFEHEIRLLRAYYYFELVRRYQNIPLVTEVVPQSEVNNLKPNLSSEILDFIIKECDDVVDLLPVDYTTFPSKEFGRVTKGVALALKSRATLYAASPLYNKNNDKAKWVAAAEAAYELIGQASELGYGLEDDFNKLFGDKNNTTKEIILFRPGGTNNDFEKKNFPFGVKEGRTSTCPSENLASEFEMADGRPFDWNNPAMKANPYEGRDPRFYQTIVHNGMPWPAKNPVEIFEGGANALPLPNATKTGYYLRKYVNNNISFEPGAPTAKASHNWILFRYAEILLNYAEAMMNAYGDAEYTSGKCPMSALEAINEIRRRPSVNMPALQNLTLAQVEHERRVELAFEGHRFWDIRRWKKLDCNRAIYGVRVIKDGSTVNYTKIQVTQRTMEDKMYFYPIRDIEIYKNSNLVQNPGW